MIDVVHRALLLLQLDQVVDDRDDVLLRQRRRRHRDVEAELPVDAVAAHVPEVIPLLVEEKAVDERLGGLQVRRVPRAELLVDGPECILLRADDVLGNRLGDDRFLVPLLHEQAELLDVRFPDPLDVLVGQRGIFRNEDLPRLLVHHVAADDPPLVVLELDLVDVDLFHEIEELEDLVVGRIAEGAQQRRHREFLLPVDVRVHHVVDIGRELHPRPAERDDPGRINRRPVRVGRFTEEHTRRPVELADDHTLRPVDDEGPAVRHRRQVPQIDVLFDRVHVRFPVLCLLGQAQLRLDGDRIGEPALLALGDRVLRFLDIVLDEFQEKILPRVGDREVHFEHRLKALVPPPCRGGVGLQETLPRLELDVEQIGCFDDLRDLAERDPLAGLVLQASHSSGK